VKLGVPDIPTEFASWTSPAICSAYLFVAMHTSNVSLSAPSSSAYSAKVASTSLAPLQFLWARNIFSCISQYRPCSPEHLVAFEALYAFV